MIKKIAYAVAAITTACIVTIPALPALFIKKEKWEKLGEKIDKAFGSEQTDKKD